MTDRLDIVVFGATGFTGRLTAEYLVKHAPIGLRLGIAGRNRAKLDEVRAQVTGGSGRALETIEADVGDPASLHAMASRTRVVATTVGPFVRYGEAVVEAAIAEGADCLDITGEPEFVANVVAGHDARARERGVRIVNCCGVDSIPHDLGALYTVNRLDKSEPIDVEGIVQAKGAVSGGTWHSAVNAFAHPAQSSRSVRALTPRLLRVERLRRGVHYEPTVGAWVAPLPTIDPLIVMRSAAAIDYGPRFRYGHFLGMKSLPALVGLGALVGGVAALAQLRPTRELLLKYKAPGEGPSEEERAKNFFRVTFLATDGKKRLVTRVAGGDPGYSETAKMLSETALALVLDRDALPARAGVLTPAAAGGERLIERLVRAGIAFETLETSEERSNGHA